MTCPSTTGCDKDCYTCEYSDYSKEEIIRCRDCKHYEKGICGELEQGNGKVLYVSGHDFCSWAEKKDQ